MTDREMHELLIQRLRRDAAALPGPSAAWSRELARALEREPLPDRRDALPNPWASAAALLATAALVIGLARPIAPPAAAPVAARPSLDGSVWPAVSERLALFLAGFLPPVEDPLRAEWGALRRDAEVVAEAMLERARGPLRPLLGALEGGS